MIALAILIISVACNGGCAAPQRPETRVIRLSHAEALNMILTGEGTLHMIKSEAYRRASPGDRSRRMQAHTERNFSEILSDLSGKEREWLVTQLVDRGEELYDEKLFKPRVHQDLD